MKQANEPVKAICFLLSLLLLLGVFVLAGCQTAESEEAGELANVEPELLETATAVSPATATPAEPTQEPPSIDNCLDCHTNKDLLIQTADPEEEVISENEGEG